jgi:hypothetical protein
VTKWPWPTIDYWSETKRMSMSGSMWNKGLFTRWTKRT